MYRDAVARAIRSRLPDVEVETCPPKDLDRKLAQLQPEVLICHDTAPETRERVPNRVEICYSDSLDTTIIREDQATRVRDISLEGLLKVLDPIALLE